MDAYSPINAYIVGLGLHAMGFHALFRPRQEYARFGLPFDSNSRSGLVQSPAKPGPQTSTETTSTTPATTSVSPLIYIKGIQEITYGLALIGLQYQGNVGGVTTVTMVVALAALGDGFVVWAHARGKQGRRKAAEHWVVGFLGLGCWAGWRAFRAYGEWAAFHALWH